MPVLSLLLPATRRCIGGMSLTNPSTGPNANAISRNQSLKRSVQDAFAGTLKQIHFSASSVYGLRLHLHLPTIHGVCCSAGPMAVALGERK